VVIRLTAVGPILRRWRRPRQGADHPREQCHRNEGGWSAPLARDTETGDGPRERDECLGRSPARPPASRAARPARAGRRPGGSSRATGGPRSASGKGVS